MAGSRGDESDGARSAEAAYEPSRHANVRAMRRRSWMIFFVIALLHVARPASASFHLTRIVEVFPGTTAAPNAQYIILQMFAAGQNNVQGQTISVYNATDSLVAVFTFLGNPANGANQSRILIATTQAQTLFGV